MASRLSSSEVRLLASLAGQLHALDEDIEAARAAHTRAVAGPSLWTRPTDADPPPPRLAGERMRLRDGAEILIRPIEPDDAPRLQLDLEHLSALSRYRRFRAPVHHLSPRQLDAATHVDHHKDEALVALDPVGRDGVGVARYTRDRDDPASAEVDYVVTDGWQRRGVGAALLERLAAHAHAAGVKRLTAKLLVGNEAARRLLAHVADSRGERSDGGVVEIEAQLRPQPVGHDVERRAAAKHGSRRHAHPDVHPLRRVQHAFGPSRRRAMRRTVVHRIEAIAALGLALLVAMFAVAWVAQDFGFAAALMLIAMGPVVIVVPVAVILVEGIDLGTKRNRLV